MFLFFDSYNRDLSHSETNSVYGSDLGFYSLIVIIEDLSHSETNRRYSSDLGFYSLIVITEICRILKQIVCIALI